MLAEKIIKQHIENGFGVEVEGDPYSIESFDGEYIITLEEDFNDDGDVESIRVYDDDVFIDEIQIGHNGAFARVSEHIIQTMNV